VVLPTRFSEPILHHGQHTAHPPRRTTVLKRPIPPCCIPGSDWPLLSSVTRSTTQPHYYTFTHFIPEDGGILPSETLVTNYHTTRRHNSDHNKKIYVHCCRQGRDRTKLNKKHIFHIVICGCDDVQLRDYRRFGIT
jgi:hypothetical protein